MLCLSNFPTLQLFNLGSLHHLPQPAAHPAQNPGAVGGVDRLWPAVADAVLHETPGLGMDGTGHGIDEPPDLLWNSDARRQLQFLADVLGAPAQQRAPSGEHDPGGDQVAVAAALDLQPEQAANLLQPRLDDLAEHFARQDSRLTIADVEYFDQLTLVDVGHRCRSLAGLPFFRLRDPRTQSDRDVAGEMMPTPRQDRGVTQTAPSAEPRT